MVYRTIGQYDCQRQRQAGSLPLGTRAFFFLFLFFISSFSFLLFFLLGYLGQF